MNKVLVHGERVNFVHVIESDCELTCKDAQANPYLLILLLQEYVKARQVLLLRKGRSSEELLSCVISSLQRY